jgi:hypothetical protein
MELLAGGAASPPRRPLPSLPTLLIPDAFAGALQRRHPSLHDRAHTLGRAGEMGNGAGWVATEIAQARSWIFTAVRILVGRSGTACTLGGTSAGSSTAKASVCV